jgi:hypothetical protein
MSNKMSGKLAELSHVKMWVRNKTPNFALVWGERVAAPTFAPQHIPVVAIGLGPHGAGGDSPLLFPTRGSTHAGLNVGKGVALDALGETTQRRER